LDVRTPLLLYLYSATSAGFHGLLLRTKLLLLKTKALQE